MKINNCRELLAGMVGSVLQDEMEAQLVLERITFKYTECGCCFSSDEGGVTVAGYSEGSDYDHFPHYLKWGFTIDEYNEALNDADAEGVLEWQRANNEDLEIVVDE